MIIGITGSYGTGKTTVSKEFAKLGAKIIDADRITHQFIDARTRSNLAKIVFKRKAYVDLLCKIIHPLVIKKINQQIRRLKPKKNLIIIDAPLLIESGLDRVVNKLIVVKAKKETQIKRLRKNKHLERSEILRRISFQMPLRKKLKMADFVIDNEGSLKETRAQVKMIWSQLMDKENK